MWVRAAWSVVMAPALAVALVACGDDAPQAGTVDERSPTSQPSPTGTETTTSNSPPPSPTTQGEEEMTGQGKVGPDAPRPSGPEVGEVEDFVRRYLEEQNEATGNGDFSDVEPMITSGCQVCKASMNNTTAVYNEGGSFDGGVFTENEIDVYGTSQDIYLVRVETVISSWKQLDASGAQVDSGPAEERVYSYGVSKNDGSWQLVTGGRTR